MAKAVSLIIPAYNEQEAVAAVIEEARRALQASGWEYEILAVDDGSIDATAEAAKRAGAKVLQAPVNMGYGGALRMGIEAASHEWIATLDADCSYPAGELPRLLENTEHFDMVVGARKGVHYWGSFIKHPARIFFLALAEFVVGARIPDVNSGMRVFKKSIILGMLPRLCRGFSFTTTMTLSFLSEHRFVKFVPIAYLPRKGKSKVRPLRDTLRTLQLLLETIVYYNPIKASLILVAPPLAGSIVFIALAIACGGLHWVFASIFLLCWSLLLLSLGFILFLLTQKK